MSWLLWREYRLNRWILVTAAVAILISYLFGSLLNSYFPDEELEDLGPNLGFAWSLLAVALLAGNAFAGERADRSAEFLAYLPLQRRRTLAGKLLLHGIVGFVLVAINLPMIMQPWGFNELGVGIGIVLVLYSVNWLVSSIQSSPAMATVSGFMKYRPVQLGVRHFDGHRPVQWLVMLPDLVHCGNPIVAVVSSLSVQPCRLTMAFIQIGAKGEVQMDSIGWTVMSVR